MFDINYNEGGRGLVYAIRFKPVFVYVAFWTKYICPRLVATKAKISFSLNP